MPECGQAALQGGRVKQPVGGGPGETLLQERAVTGQLDDGVGDLPHDVLGVVSNLASIAAAFGVAKLIFQDGHLSGLLNFEPQGYVDAWGPLFFGAMLSGVAIDYTLFLLSAAREHYDLSGDPQHAMRMALRTSGRVVVAAAGVMVAVFLTFALSGPLAPKEMGIILAVAVFVDALLIRLALLPVVLRLTGHGAWQRPAWLNKVLPQVHFTH